MGGAADTRRPRRRNEPWGRVARPVPATYTKWVVLPAFVAPAGSAHPKGTGPNARPPLFADDPAAGSCAETREPRGLGTIAPAETRRSKGRQDPLPPLSHAAPAAGPESSIYAMRRRVEHDPE